MIDNKILTKLYMYNLIMSIYIYIYIYAYTTNNIYKVVDL
jgi:hypothetical protein